MDTATLLQAMYKAFRENRLAEALSYLDDDFKLSIRLPDDGIPDQDRPRSKAEAALLFRKFADRFDLIGHEPGLIIVSGTSASAQPELVMRHRLTGKTLAARFKHTWRIVDGKARELAVEYDVPQIQDFLRSVGEEAF